MESLFAENPAYAFLGSAISCLLYAGLFEFGYNHIIQKLYSWLQGSTMFKIQSYLVLINLPFLLLILFGVIGNNSILPLDVTLKIDSSCILIVSSYICYLQQSRQTPLRGFVVLKDTFFIMVCLGLSASLYLTGEVSIYYLLLMIFFYILNLFFQAYTNQLEDFLLLLLGVRQKNTYRAAFLLTQKSHPSDFLQIKDIISTYEERIDEQIEDFIRIATELKKSNEQLTVLANFARLFLPIKTAYQIHEQLIKEKNKLQFEERWFELSKQDDNERELEKQDDTYSKGQSFDQSGSTLFVKRTLTNDSVIDNEDSTQMNENIIDKVIKYSCYPLYLSMQIDGRLRYFMDYLIVGLMAATMWVLSNGICAFSIIFSENRNLVSLVFCLFLIYPFARYFIRISSGSNDYDFLGIFMQGVIMKLVVFSVVLTIQSFIMGNSIQERGNVAFVNQMIRLSSYLIMGIYMTWKRFATRYSNFKVFLVVYIVTESLKIAQENVYDHAL